VLGALTYHAVAALTRDRLHSIESRLQAKINAGTNITDLERQVHFLAWAAGQAMSFGPHLPNETSLPPFARRLSKQTVFGSVGLTVPRFGGLYAPGQRWLFDTLHAGTPDPNRQRVLARSTDLLLAIARRGTELINQSNVPNKPDELNKLRAYLLGHASHIAADFVIAPFLNAAAWQLGDSTHSRLSTDQIMAAIDTAAAQLFRRDGSPPSVAASGDLYKGWWLDPSDLPAKFFDAYRDAIEANYGPGARPVLRPTSPAGPSLTPQVSHAFFQQFQSNTPPDLSVDLLKDAYDAFRSVMETQHVWTFGDWLAGTALIFLPPLVAYPLIVAMPHTRALFKDNATVDGHPVDSELGWFGLVMAPLATSSLAPLVLSMYFAATTYRGVEAESVLGWVTGGIDLISSIVFLATINDPSAPLARWLLLFVLPILGLLFHALYVLGRGKGDPRHRQLAMSSLLPLLIVGIYVLFHLAVHQSQDLGMNGWLKDSGGQPEGWGSAGFIGGWVMWAVLLLGAWLATAAILRAAQPSDPATDEFVTRTKHFLRMFPQVSLLFDANLAADPTAESRRPSLATHYFPTDQRPLLKIWWEGGGDLFFRSDRAALTFSTSADGSANQQTVLAPAAPMTASQFATFLTAAVKEGDAFSSKLKAELVDPSDFDYVLPPGNVFADAGDDRATIADHDTAAAQFARLATTRDAATVLYHAPRAHVAGFMGTNGPVRVDDDRRVAVRGDGQATFNAVTVTGTATRFSTFFEPGDIIATVGVAGGDQSRLVVSIADDTTLTVNQPFTVPAGLQNYQRSASSRDIDTFAGPLQSGNVFRQYQGTGFDSTFLAGDELRALAIPAPTMGKGQATFTGTTVNGFPDGGGVPTAFTSFFQRGDIIATLGFGPNDEFRVVADVSSDDALTVSVPFTPAVGGPKVWYWRYRPNSGEGQVTIAGTSVTGDSDTRFKSFFSVGDVIASSGGATGEECRIITSIQDDRTLTVLTPFTAAVVGASSVHYARLKASLAQERTVTTVNSPTLLTLDKPLVINQLPAGPSTAVCLRIGRLTREGFRVAPVAPTGIFEGDSLIDTAADLGAMLCMAATTHMMTTPELQGVAPAAAPRHPAVNPVFQVFRNWNLSQRRFNEWQMLVSGGAVSEKRGAPREPDPLQLGVQAVWHAPDTGDGETIANQLGWLTTMQKWLDVAARPEVNSLADVSLHEGDPTNKQLSRAVAFLFDLTMPP
jgi:hypothetical protein